MDLFCRVTSSYESLESFFSSLTDSCSRIVVYQHDTTRVHVHFYIVGCQLSTDTLKYRIKRSLGVSSYPKTDWSFTTAKDDGCIVYMSKGVLDPVFAYGFTDDEILACKLRWNPDLSKPSNRSKYQTRLTFVTRETPAQSKKRKNDLIEEMRIALSSHKLINITHHVDTKVIDVIISTLNNNNVCLTRYTIREYYDTLCSRINPESFRDFMVGFLQPKHF